MTVELSGIVVAGEGKASRLGFPTINIDYGRVAFPVDVGVYAGVLKHGAIAYRGVICVGPVRHSDRLKLEIHCFDHVPLHRGDTVVCTFYEQVSDFIRGDDNVMQQKIADDVKRAQEFFASGYSGL